MNRIQLNSKNYYSSEADWQYMSVSQYKSFLECEAATLAKLKKEWIPLEVNKALLVGNYVHSYFESEEAHEEFIEENKEKLYSTKKPYGLLKDFKIADQMIRRLEKEKAFINLYQGKKEVILTGKLFDIDWKAKIDCLNLENNYFVDLKTAKNIRERKYDSYWGQGATFIERYGYLLQVGVYQELLNQTYGELFTPFIAAVSKQTPSAAALITLDEMKISSEMTQLQQNITHVFQVKMGEVSPNYCGNCDYCRENKRIDGFINMNDL